MNKLFFLIFLCISLTLSLASNHSDDIRTIQLDLFDHEDSYLPVRPGSRFILEAKGNKLKGFTWTLENAKEIEENGILKVLNIDEDLSGDYYHHHDEKIRHTTDGIFHFKFEASKSKFGMEKLEFHYKKISTKGNTEEVDDKREIKKVNINVVGSTDL